MAKWTRNHALEIGGTVALLGLIMTVISFTYKYASTAPSFLASYADLVRRPEGDYNLFPLIVGPIMLVIGGFYVGEQIVLRRRFERTLATPQKSEFAKRRKDLEDLAKRLPDKYRGRIDAKEAEFKSKRSV